MITVICMSALVVVAVVASYNTVHLLLFITTVMVDVTFLFWGRSAYW